MTRYLVHWLYNDCLHNFKKNLKNQAKSLYMYDQKWKTFPYHMLSYIRFFFLGGGGMILNSKCICIKQNYIK